MRLLPMFLALAACDYVPPTSTDTGHSTNCPQGSNWLATESAGMTLTFLAVDGASVQATFDPTAEYDTVGPSACYDSTSSSVAWVFASGNEPFGRLTVTPGGTGAQAFDGSSGSTFSLDVFGAPTPMVWSNTDFLLGNFTVNSVAPDVSLNLNADTAKDGRIINVNLSAEMTTDIL